MTIKRWTGVTGTCMSPSPASCPSSEQKKRKGSSLHGHLLPSTGRQQTELRASPQPEDGRAAKVVRCAGGKMLEEPESAGDPVLIGPVRGGAEETASRSA